MDTRITAIIILMGSPGLSRARLVSSVHGKGSSGIFARKRVQVKLCGLLEAVAYTRNGIPA
jgi:hypothetical protein